MYRKRLTRRTARFLHDDSGATMIEYGLLAALLSVFVVGGTSLAGEGLDSIFTEVNDCLQGGSGNGTCR